MNIYSLELNIKSQPEALERLLRVIRHRGFNIKNLNMQSMSSKGSIITMLVDSERDISLLTNQINKLLDVIDCQVLQNLTNELNILEG